LVTVGSDRPLPPNPILPPNPMKSTLTSTIVQPECKLRIAREWLDGLTISYY
jgi:hypothetical protein